MAYPEYRFVERRAACRACHRELLPKVDRAVCWYSSCNRGMTIIICKDCVDQIHRITEVDQ